MIFVGDIASPNQNCSDYLLQSLKKYRHIFKDNCTIANLEGLISTRAPYDNEPILYNHPSVINILKEMNTRVVTLANNHTLDLPHSFENTKRTLELNKIKWCGAGETKSKAGEATRFLWKEREVYVLGYCWGVLIHHQQNPSGNVYLNTIDSKRALKKIIRLRSLNPSAIIIIKMHWSFDLETAPFPMYRKLSKALIDAGANAVIGSHSHCIQGGERYKNGIIVYGLGNFYIPWYTFINGTIQFPEFARNEMLLDWNYDSGEVTCHFFKYYFRNGKHGVDLIATEDFDKGELINKYSRFRKLSDSEFEKWYQKNRRKKTLIPVYRDHEDLIRNQFYDILIIARMKIARFLAEYNLRKWNN